MAHKMTRPSTGAPPISQARPCPQNTANHVILDLSEDEARLAGLGASRVVHVDRSRQPTTGDRVWVELVRHGSTQRLVRSYALDGGWVTLSTPGSSAAAIMRRRAEVLVLGVVTDTADCPGRAA
ncbi:MAG: hypothetical protein IT306_28830 [Chloroflexi bacterium]|nr:hypothetical protein [Chloroflexota bacterium]